MKSCRILYILVLSIALGQFSAHGSAIPDPSTNEKPKEKTVEATTVTAATEIDTQTIVIERGNDALVLAKGGGVVAGSVKDGDAIAVAVSKDENGTLSSAIIRDGEGAISAATGDGKALSSGLNNSTSTVASSNNGTAVAAKGEGNTTVSGNATSGSQNEAKTSVISNEGNASGSASGKGAASVSNVKGKKSSGSVSAATGISNAMGTVKDVANGIGEVLGTLTISDSKSSGGVASSASATSGKAATSLSGSSDNKDDVKDEKRAGALAISTNNK